MHSSLKTRAVLRPVEPGEEGECVACGARIKFKAVQKPKQVIANVYGRNGDPDVWDRLEQFHQECYTGVGQPYGLTG